MSVPRTARYYTLGRGQDAADRAGTGKRRGTTGAAGAAVSEVWLVCHGYGQLAGPFARQFAVLDDGRRLIVAPEALSRFYLDPPVRRSEVGAAGSEMGREMVVPAAERRVGATWMTREDREHEIADQIAYLDALHARVAAPLAEAGARVVVLGFSQGVATVSRWFAATRARIDRLIIWGGHLPPELDLTALGSRFAAVRLVIVAGTADPLVTPQSIADETARFRVLGLPFRLVTFDGGHEIDPRTLLTVAES